MLQGRKGWIISATPELLSLEIDIESKWETNEIHDSVSATFELPSSHVAKKSKQRTTEIRPVDLAVSAKIATVSP